MPVEAVWIQAPAIWRLQVTRWTPFSANGACRRRCARWRRAGWGVCFPSPIASTLLCLTPNNVTRRSMRLAVCLLLVCAGAAAAAAANDDWKKPDFCGQRDCPRFQLVGPCARGGCCERVRGALLPAGLLLASSPGPMAWWQATLGSPASPRHASCCSAGRCAAGMPPCAPPCSSA